MTDVERTVDLRFRFLQQNRGRISPRAETKAAAVETAYAEAFGVEE